MNKERFAEILKEYNYSDRQIDLLWNSKGDRVLDEEKVRLTAEHFAAIKDSLIQA